jgi:uncharacterized surface protein with fasciclin (FAS1) repeats
VEQATTANTRSTFKESSSMFKSIVLSAIAVLLIAGTGVAAPKEGAKLKNIVQTARNAGTFSTLLAALEATDLVGTLSGKGQGTFTVFAPTDEAFAKLPAGTVESLLKDPAALKQILLYHVVQGEVPASEVVQASSLATLNGGSLTVSTVGGVKVDDAVVVATAIRARNGIIHVIDTVLIPR